MGQLWEQLVMYLIITAVRGSEVKKYKEQDGPYREEVGMDGQV